MTVGSACSQSVSELLAPTNRQTLLQIIQLLRMNVRVRRYQPLFLSPQHDLSYKSPSKASGWKAKINHEVTLCYDRIQRNSQHHSQQPDTEPKSLHEPNQCRIKSCSTQSDTETPLKRQRLDLSSNPNLSTTILKTPRQRQLQSYYSQRIQLLQQQCSYLRSQFISHCLRHHRPQFQRVSL